MSALDVAVGMVCGCAAVRTALGAASVAAAKSLCVAEDGGAFDFIDDGATGDGRAYDGSAITYEPPLLVVQDSGVTGEPLDAPAALRYRGELRVLLILASPAVADLTGTTQARWARGVQDTVRDELLAQVGGASAFSMLAVDCPRPWSLALDATAFAGCWMIPLDLRWE